MSAPTTVTGPGPALWVLADGRAHLLTDNPAGSVLVAWCGHPLRRRVLVHSPAESRVVSDVCDGVFAARAGVFPDPDRPPVERPRIGSRRPIGSLFLLMLSMDDFTQGRSPQLNEPHDVTGDPWIVAYVTFRRAWVQGGTENELTDLAMELKQELPTYTPSIPAALFIHRDILITSQRNTLLRQLATALWVPNRAHTSA